MVHPLLLAAEGRHVGPGDLPGSPEPERHGKDCRTL